MGTPLGLITEIEEIEEMLKTINIERKRIGTERWKYW